MKNQQRGEIAVCGLEAVRALADARPTAVRRFFCEEARVREFGALCSALAASRRPYRVVASDELARISGTVHHQGVVAMVADASPLPVDDATVRAWSGKGARVVLLDRVGDDHNLGSIARTAAFFGYAAIVLSSRDGAARLTTSAYRVARGALERIEVRVDESAARFLARCKGQMPSVGADHRAAIDIRSYGLPSAPGSASLPAAADGTGRRTPLTVVLGNEETGLGSDTRDACDALVRIDGDGAVESLNVAQAAAVFLFSFSRG